MKYINLLLTAFFLVSCQPNDPDVNLTQVLHIFHTELKLERTSGNDFNPNKFGNRITSIYNSSIPSVYPKEISVLYKEGEGFVGYTNLTKDNPKKIFTVNVDEKGISGDNNKYVETIPISPSNTEETSSSSGSGGNPLLWYMLGSMNSGNSSSNMSSGFSNSGSRYVPSKPRTVLPSKKSFMTKKFKAKKLSAKSRVGSGSFSSGK